MMWWAIWCVVLVASGACAEAAPASNGLATSGDWSPVDVAPDEESLGYAVSPMGGRYGASAPWLYLLAEMPRDSQVPNGEVAMRQRRDFSILPAVDILHRAAYNNYQEKLAHKNRDFLNCIGKRDPWSSGDCRLKN